MSGWSKDKHYGVMRAISNKEVKSYIDCGMNVIRYDGWNPQAKECFKTFAINCGSYDGENIDLFDLQDWFDKNREWINSLREEVKE